MNIKVGNGSRVAHERFGIVVFNIRSPSRSARVTAGTFGFLILTQRAECPETPTVERQPKSAFL